MSFYRVVDREDYEKQLKDLKKQHSEELNQSGINKISKSDLEIIKLKQKNEKANLKSAYEQIRYKKKRQDENWIALGKKINNGETKRSEKVPVMPEPRVNDALRIIQNNSRFQEVRKNNIQTLIDYKKKVKRWNKGVLNGNEHKNHQNCLNPAKITEILKSKKIKRKADDLCED